MARHQTDRTDRVVAAAAVVLPAAVRQAIVDHAMRDRPLECCGLLVGREGSVTAAIPMRNVEASPTRFRLDDREHIELRRSLRLLSPPQQIVGVYHSHPDGPARLSPVDIAEAHYPGWLHVVVGLVGGRTRVRGFSIEADRVRPVRLRASNVKPGER